MKAVVNPTLPRLAVPISRLHEDPKNACLHDDRNVAAIAASLKAFGQQKPIVALWGGTVVAGNGTLRAARTLGWAETAVVWFDSREAARARAFDLADNRTAELATWDVPILQNILANLKTEGFDLAGTLSFSEADLQGTWPKHFTTGFLPGISLFFGGRFTDGVGGRMALEMGSVESAMAYVEPERRPYRIPTTKMVFSATDAEYRVFRALVFSQRKLHNLEAIVAATRLEVGQVRIILENMHRHGLVTLFRSREGHKSFAWTSALRQNSDPTPAAIVAGGLFGAAVGGPVGALVGALLGGILGGSQRHGQ